MFDRVYGQGRYVKEPKIVGECKACDEEIYDYEKATCENCGELVHDECLAECKNCKADGCKKCFIYDDEKSEWFCGEECKETELQEAASKAITTGNLKDLHEYLELRREKIN